jgi:hypothetical protein
MSTRLRTSNYVHLALQATFVYLALNYLRAVPHEIGHGLAASVVGLKFIGLYGALFGFQHPDPGAVSPSREGDPSTVRRPGREVVTYSVVGGQPLPARAVGVHDVNLVVVVGV